MKGFWERLSSQVKEKMTRETLLRLVVAAGIIGMLLILLSSFWPDQDNGREKNIPSAAGSGEAAGQGAMAFAEAYRMEAETRLTETLSKLSGVGRTEVMLTVTCTEETVYAQSVRESSDRVNGERSSMQRENSYILLEQNGQKSALVNKILTPKVGGVIVLCEGGGSAVVREAVSNAVSTVLDIPVSQIYVAKIQ